MFRHPSYYKKLRELRNKSDQAISQLAEPVAGRRAPGQGHKQQAASDSQVVNQVKLSSQSQASSSKLQAPSPKHKGSSFKPQASSALIPDPGKSFTDL